MFKNEISFVFIQIFVQEDIEHNLGINPLLSWKALYVVLR